MLKKLMAALLFTLPVAAALAMSQSSVPTKFAIPWGNSAGTPYIRVIPQTSQIGIQNCAASLTDGFPPLTFVPATSGGCPPFGADFNGILKQITQWSQWQGAGASPLYDASFSSSIGGYPSGAVLANASTPGCFWVSTTDNNVTNPDTGGAGWNFSCPGGGVGGTSTGSANSQTVSATPMVLKTGMMVTFTAGFTNTGPLKINVNGTGLLDIYRTSQLGSTLSVGGEVVAGQLIRVQYDGTRWQCQSCAAAMVGEIKDYGGSTAPAGWAFIDGSCNSQTTYADLFSVVGTNYGSCTAGNFAFPDGRGRALVGLDNFGTGAGAASRLTNAATGCGTAMTTIGSSCANASQSHTLTTSEMPAHSHTYSHPQTFSAQAGGTSTNAGVDATLSTSTVGGGTAHPIVNPNIAVSKIIKL